MNNHILPPCPAVSSLNLPLSLPPSPPLPQAKHSAQHRHSTQHTAFGVRSPQSAPRGKAPSGWPVLRKFDRGRRTGLRGVGKIVRAKFLGEAAVQGGGAVRCMLLQAGKGPASPSLQADLLTTYFHTRPTFRCVECDARVHPVLLVSVVWW